MSNSFRWNPFLQPLAFSTSYLWLFSVRRRKKKRRRHVLSFFLVFKFLFVFKILEIKVKFLISLFFKKYLKIFFSIYFNFKMLQQDHFYKKNPFVFKYFSCRKKKIEKKGFRVLTHFNYKVFIFFVFLWVCRICDNMVGEKWCHLHWIGEGS